jgi:hypothetical protein
VSNEQPTQRPRQRLIEQDAHWRRVGLPRSRGPQRPVRGLPTGSGRGMAHLHLACYRRSGHGA